MPSPLHTAVISAFQTQGWAYHEVPGMEVVEAGFDAYHGRVRLHVQSFGAVHIVSVVAQGSPLVPATHRGRAAELLMRANKELNLGNFEMDWDEGVVMFRVTNLFPEDRVDQKIIASLVHNAVVECDRLAPFLGELCRTEADRLPVLDVRGLLRREELLPPTPEFEP